MITGKLTIIHGDKSKTDDFNGTIEDFHTQINSLIQDGWKSSNLFKMNGDVEVKMSGKNYGVNATLTGTLTKTK